MTSTVSSTGNAIVHYYFYFVVVRNDHAPSLQQHNIIETKYRKENHETTAQDINYRLSFYSPTCDLYVQKDGISMRKPLGPTFAYSTCVN